MPRPAQLRFLADENVAESVIARLRELSVDVASIDDLGLRGQPDHRLLEVASPVERVVLTQDTDFGQLAIAHGTPCFGIVLLRPGDLLPSELLVLLEDFRRADRELPVPFIVVLEPGSTRVRAL